MSTDANDPNASPQQQPQQPSSGEPTQQLPPQQPAQPTPQQPTPQQPTQQPAQSTPQQPSQQPVPQPPAQQPPQQPAPQQPVQQYPPQQPAQAYPPQQPAQPTTPGQPPSGGGSEGSGKKLAMIGGAVVVVIALVVGALFGFGVIGGDDKSPVAVVSPDRVFLASANTPGTDPFSTESFGDAPDPLLATPVTEPNTTIPTNRAPQVTTLDGDTAGLYGGTQKAASCDPAKIISFLTKNPAKATAWVSAFGADPDLRAATALTTSTIGDYVKSLTSVVLRRDLTLTNLGLKADTVTRAQYVLQKGTAVLVDPYGVPRVKCYSSNPLMGPLDIKKATFAGDKWQDFNPYLANVVKPSATKLAALTLVDPATTQAFSRPAGTQGPQDTPTTLLAAVPTTTPAPGASTPPAATPAATTPPAATPTDVRHASGAFKVQVPGGWGSDNATYSVLNPKLASITTASDLQKFQLDPTMAPNYEVVDLAGDPTATLTQLADDYRTTFGDPACQNYNGTPTAYSTGSWTGTKLVMGPCTGSTTTTAGAGTTTIQAIAGELVFIAVSNGTDNVLVFGLAPSNTQDLVTKIEASLGTFSR